VPIGYRYTIGDPRYDWCFQAAPDANINGRSISHPRGKLIGGRKMAGAGARQARS
jgi:choline dehydrogenase